MYVHNVYMLLNYINCMLALIIFIIGLVIYCVSAEARLHSVGQYYEFNTQLHLDAGA